MKYDTSKLNQEGVKASQRGQNWDHNDQARYDKWAEAKDRSSQYKPAVEPDNDSPTYAGGTPGFYDKNVQANQTIEGQGPNSKGGSGGGPKQTQASQNVNQNNDINSSVNGDKNYVYNNQDNSIRHYGGDNRSFVYNSNGEGPDTPATMATLAGYYAPDDSPGARASRLNQNVMMNRDNQKKYANTSYIAEGAIARAERNRFIDPAKLDQRIHKRSQYHRDQSTIKGAEIFGDIYGLESPTWNSATPANPVEKPDFEKMYDKYTDF